MTIEESNKVTKSIGSIVRTVLSDYYEIDSSSYFGLLSVLLNLGNSCRYSKRIQKGIREFNQILDHRKQDPLVNNFFPYNLIYKGMVGVYLFLSHS